MRMLKDQLHHSHQYSLVEKRLLWSAFTVAFCGFLRISEFMSSTPIGATILTWSDIEFSPSYISSFVYVNPKQTHSTEAAQ